MGTPNTEEIVKMYNMDLADAVKKGRVELARELYLIISTNQYSPSNINELIKRLEVEIKNDCFK